MGLSVEFLGVFWYVIIFVSLFAFAALDGFDLGVGMLHLFSRTDEERRIFLNAIGPVWDGNSVWLVIVTGALFAGFPLVFGTLFSALYNLIIILLGGIVFRTVAIEFRSKRESHIWRSTWDFLFFFASLVMSITVGIILANIVAGIPVDADGVFQGSFSSFFNFYTLIFAMTVVSLFMMHGAIYLLMKTESILRHHMKRWSAIFIFFFIFSVGLLTISTWFLHPHMVRIFLQKSWLLVFPAIGIVFTLLIIKAVLFNHMGLAFIWSSGVIAILFLLCALGKFPVLLHSTFAPQVNFTIANSRSSHKTLTVLFYIVIIGVPFVLAYSIWLYRLFRGKVVVDSHSY